MTKDADLSIIDEPIHRYKGFIELEELMKINENLVAVAGDQVSAQGFLKMVIYYDIEEPKQLRKIRV